MPNLNPNKELEALREQLAAIEHERWSDWQKWMHSQMVNHAPSPADGTWVCLPSELYRRWERQIATPYERLTPAEKLSDLEQVDRYWPLLQDFITQSQHTAVQEYSQWLLSEYALDATDRVDEYFSHLSEYLER